MELKLKWAILLFAGLIIAGCWGYSQYQEQYGNGQFEKIAPIGATP